MNKLPKDVIVLLALDLTLPDIISLCQTKKRIDQIICQNPNFWRQKIQRDFPGAKYDQGDNPKQIYFKIGRILKKYPELRDIIPLIVINRFDVDFPLREEYEYPDKLLNLLDALPKSLLYKIMNDYNSHEIYGEKRQVMESTRQAILHFMNDAGLIYTIEYEVFYNLFVKELQYFMSHPDYTFDPAIWEIGSPYFS